jgi:predicted O-linked N-acetylglucosamine transferase (SPINDLY family)
MTTKTIVPGITEQIAKYEIAINQEGSIASNYWWLGISYLLSGDEIEAQATWFIPIANAEDTETENLTADLVNTLSIAAQQQAEIGNYSAALLLRQHLQEIDENQLDNILELIILSEKCNQLTPDCTQQWQLELLVSLSQEINQELLQEAFNKLLLVFEPENADAIMSCLHYSSAPEILLEKATQLAIELSCKDFHDEAILILEKCLIFKPNDAEILSRLSAAYSKKGKHSESIAIAEKVYYLSSSQSLLHQMKSSYDLMSVLMTASSFINLYSFVENYRSIVYQLITESQIDSNSNAEDTTPDRNQRHSQQMLAFTLFFFPYIEDKPAQTNHYLNLAGNKVKQDLKKAQSVQSLNIDPTSKISDDLNKPLGIIRIGYIASTLYTHPVGWLSRWLWQYRDHDQFQVFTYCVEPTISDEFNNHWFRDQSDITYYLPCDVEKIAAQIKYDKIDILVDLDSLTSTHIYAVMSRRLAPVQITWLGWDASGAPEVDYFIADPYVLPDNAQDYYSEKIWRLPHTYVAVDGFEVGTPTIRRETLNIPPSAVVYYSAQVGYKIHPDTVRLQFQILQQVPDSFLLIKARTDNTAVSNFYQEIADEIGLDFSRLRFLDKDPDELTHRANLQIADVMLDSFPYNGATTTLETLWLGIPLVTRVGQQFAARNSYTFMVNTGITEGIAWSAQEYLEWGIRLGTNGDLRQQVAGKLLDARSTAPLWNARQFTKDMEDAYRGMWEHHQQKETKAVEQ